MSVASLQNSQSFSQTSQTAKRMLADQVITDGSTINYFNDKFTFPLFSEIIRTTKLNSIICGFILFFFLSQSFEYLPMDSQANSSFINADNENIVFIFSIVYFGLNLSFFVVLFGYYRINRVFAKWQVYLSLFIFSGFNVVLFAPFCSVCGYSIRKINQLILDNQKRAMALDFITDTHQGSMNMNFNNLSKPLMNTVISNSSKIIKEAVSIDNFQNSINMDIIDLIYNKDFTTSCIWCAFFLIEIAYIFYQIVLSSHFMNESPYLNRSLLGMWDVKMFLTFIFALGLSAFLTFVIPLFKPWCTIVVQLFMLFYVVYILYLSYLQPFFNRKSSVFFSSMLTMSVFNVFLSFIQSCAMTSLSLFGVKFVVSFIIFIISLIVYKYLQRKMYTVINDKLSPPKDDSIIDDTDNVKKSRMPLTKKRKERKKREEYFKQQFKKITDEEKRERFDSFVFQNEDHALLYLRIGVSMASPFLIDFSFVQYMKECYDYSRIQFMILRICALFPSQQQFFTFCMKNLMNKDEFLNQYQRFVLYQLRRVHIIRQASMCQQIHKELAPLQKMTDDSISAVKSFWAEILQVRNEINTTSLNYIKKKTNLTKSNYIDIIERYPNSPQILNNYCRFLCDACGDFKECAKIGQKMRLTEQGKNVDTDLCYQSFVNTFPHYLKYRILDMKGSFLGNSAVISQQSSVSISSDRMSASSDNVKKYVMSSTTQYMFQSKPGMDQLFEQEQYEHLLNSLFKHGRLRIAIQHIMDKAHNTALDIAKRISWFQFILSVLFLIAFTIVMSIVTQSPLHMIESSTITSNIVSSLQYSSLIAGIQYLETQIDGEIYEYILQNLHIDANNLPHKACSFINPIIALDLMKVTIADQIDEELKLIMNNPGQHLDEIHIYNALDNNLLSEANPSSIMTSVRNGKFNSPHGVPLLTADETFQYYKNPINSVLFNKRNTKEDFLDINYTKYGIFIFKTVDGELKGYPMPLRNGLEYYQAVCSRLGFEQAIRASEMMANETNQTFGPSNNQIISTGYKNYTDDEITILQELHINGYVLAIPFYNLFGVISNNGSSLSNDRISAVQVISSIVVAIFILAFPIRRFVNLFYIKQSFELTSDILSTIKSEDISKVKKQIYLKYKQRLSVKSVTTQSIHESSILLILYPILFVLSSAVFAVVSSALIYQFSTAFKYISDSYQLFSQSTRRFWGLMQLMNCLICEKTGIFDFDIFDQISESAFKIFLSSELLDLTLIKKDSTMRSYYFTVADASDNIDYQLNKIIDIIESKKAFSKFNVHNHPIFNLTSKGVKKLQNTRKLNLRSNKTMQKARVLSNEGYKLAASRITNSTCSSINISDIANPYNVGRYLDCISINNRVNIGISYLMAIDPILSDKPLIEIPEFLACLYLIDAHLFADLSDYQAKLTDSFISTISTMTSSIIVIVVVGILIMFVVFIFEYFSLKILESSFDAFKQLIMVLPPKAFVTTPCLTNFLAASCPQSFTIALKQLSKKKSKAMFHSKNFLNTDVLQGRVSLSDHVVQSQEAILIHNLNDAIIMISSEMLIEFVNPALEKITGFSADQILGQNLIWLIPVTPQVNANQTVLFEMPFYQRLDEIKAHTGKQMIEVNTICVTDKGTEKIVRATIIGLFECQTCEENEESMEVFTGAAIILKDVSEELRQKKLVKESKEVTEAMMKFILPPMILDDLETSKKAILYSVNKATLIKIQLTGYDYYINTMMPKDLISSLNVIYTKIEQIRHSENPILLGQPTQSSVPGNDTFQIAFDAFTFNSDTGKSFWTTNSAKSQFSNTANDNDDDDQSNSIYNLRNDNDCLVYVCGVFDNQEKYEIQAESSVKFAVQVKKIIEEASETANIFLHVRIAIVMGGPIDCYVSNPQMPNIAVLSELLKTADDIRRHYNQDETIYINEELCKHLNPEQFSIEEVTFDKSKDKIYTVNEFLENLDDE